MRTPFARRGAPRELRVGGGCDAVRRESTRPRGTHSSLFLRTDLSRREDDETLNFTLVKCTMQGWRKTMEDYLEIHDFPKFPHIKLLGVFDGHGGPWIAEHAGTRIAEVFEKHLEVCRRVSPRASLSFEMSPRASSLGLKRAPVPVGCEGAVTAARAAALSLF